ncbi:MAG: hypothetical protein P4L00_06900 [Candidatus Acidoferrales bacterium]|nr:hypothetical protein [Candidatus Acidoferrales bacterium]
MMTTRVSIRGAVCAAVITLVLAFAGAATARAQGAAGAGASSSESALPAQPKPNRASSNSLPAAANTSARSSEDSYEPITGEQRLEWLAKSTLYPKSLLAGLFSAAIGTGLDHPREDGPHWGGFGERYGIRLTGIATSDTMEVGLGALWGEDPRYKREPEKSFGGRLGSVVEQGFMTRRRDGHFAPAYARYLAVSGSNFLSNTWRADSEADSTHAGYRIGLGFAGQIGSNAWDEFWPSISSHIFHHGN